MQARAKDTLMNMLINDPDRPPSLRLVESCADLVVLEGNLRVNSVMDGFEHIDETIRLRIEIDRRYREILPRVIDVDSRIERSMKHHIYSDGSFCLGSDLRMKRLLSNDFRISTFIDKCVEPYLYSVLHKQKHDTFPYGELKHGSQGLIDDYMDLFKLPDAEAVIQALQLLGTKKRIANKMKCPCRCGKRLGRCDLHLKLNSLRKMGSRRFYLNHINSVSS